MEYLPSFKTIIKGFAALLLFVYLKRWIAFPVLFKVAAGAEPESPDEPHEEENPPSRDPDHYYQATTIVLRVCLLHLLFYRNILTQLVFRSRIHSFACTKTSCSPSKVLCGREYVNPASHEYRGMDHRTQGPLSSTIFLSQNSELYCITSTTST